MTNNLLAENCPINHVHIVHAIKYNFDSEKYMVSVCGKEITQCGVINFEEVKFYRGNKWEDMCSNCWDRSRTGDNK